MRTISLTETEKDVLLTLDSFKGIDQGVRDRTLKNYIELLIAEATMEANIAKIAGIDAFLKELLLEDENDGY